MSGSDRPVVGLTSYRQRAVSGVWDVEASFLPAQYIDGVTRAGGIGLLLPPQPVNAEVAATVLDRVDALLLTGGVDVDPARYGQDRHAETDPAQPLRDDWESALVLGAIERGLPFLAVCRGAQVLNVALGGTLHQHVPDVVGHESHRFGQATFTANDVTTSSGSLLASILGETLPGQCYHHQAIDTVGHGLVVTARDAENVIEAVELPEHPFGLAVQWHPEESLDDLRLFRALVDAASRRKVAA